MYISFIIIIIIIIIIIEVFGYQIEPNQRQ